MESGDEPDERDGQSADESSPDPQSEAGDEPSAEDDTNTEAASETEDGSSAEESSATESDSEASSDTTESSGGIRQAITKRRILGGVAVSLVLIVILLLLFVPTSLLTLVYSSSAEFDAQPAAGSQEMLAEHGYTAESGEEFVVEEEISFLGTKTIVTTNHRQNYQRSIDVQGEQFDAAIFTVVSTPAIEVLGTPRNPLASMSHEELLNEFSSELEGGYDNLDDMEKVDERDGVLAGRETTVSQFEMTVQQDGEDVDVVLYVASVQSNGDLVVAVGGHPAPFAQERLSILELMATVEHPSG